MAKDSKIEWTHHTFNPWWGCAKVSPACKHCYAETWAKRVGKDLWGAKSPRRFFSDAHWREPLKWNAEALALGERRRVFCASMADVFEARAELDPWRERLWRLIEATPGLDWLLLTKRPHRITSHAPWSAWPAHVWLGTTAENQKWADLRIPELVKCDAAVHFISAEPLLGAIDLSPWLKSGGIDWVIAGGESGPRARPTAPAWVRALRDQCAAHDVAFHFKQWGHWAPSIEVTTSRVKTQQMDGGNGMLEIVTAVGKKAAGRSLDGQLWNGIPSRGKKEEA